jgi:hypothetical protein
MLPCERTERRLFLRTLISRARSRIRLSRRRRPHRREWAGLKIDLWLFVPQSPNRQGKDTSTSCSQYGQRKVTSVRDAATEMNKAYLP